MLRRLGILIVFLVVANIANTAIDVMLNIEFADDVGFSKIALHDGLAYSVGIFIGVIASR